MPCRYQNSTFVYINFNHLLAYLHAYFTWHFIWFQMMWCADADICIGREYNPDPNGKYT